MWDKRKAQKGPRDQEPQKSRLMIAQGLQAVHSQKQPAPGEEGTGSLKTLDPAFYRFTTDAALTEMSLSVIYSCSCL